MLVSRLLGLPSVASIPSGLPSSRPHLESLQHQMPARVSPLLVWRLSAMGHSAPVMELAGSPSRTAYTGARPAYLTASHRSCRPAPPRTSLASHRVQLSCGLRQDHGDSSCLHDVDSCRLCCHDPIPSLHHPDPVSTPPRSSILRHPSPVWTYMGPTLTEGWFPEIFGGTTTDRKATLLTLTSSNGRPTVLGLSLIHI